MTHRSASLALLSLLGCTQAEPLPTVRVLAPVALQPVLDSAIGQWQLDHGTRALVGYDTPDRLQRQADGGTLADVFIAADRRWMDALEADGHIPEGDRRALAFDPLVFVSRNPQTPARDPVELRELAASGARVGMLSRDLPEGAVTQDALQSTQIWTAIEPSVVAYSTSRALQEALETGAVEVGVCRNSSVMAAYDLLATHPFSQDHRYGSLVELALLRLQEEEAELARSLAVAITEGPGARASLHKAGLVVAATSPGPHADPGPPSAGPERPPRPPGAPPGPPPRDRPTPPSGGPMPPRDAAAPLPAMPPSGGQAPRRPAR